METYCLYGSSALEFWRLWRLWKTTGLLRMGVRPTGPFCQDWRCCQTAGPLPQFKAFPAEILAALTAETGPFLSKPIDLLVHARASRSHTSAIECHRVPSCLSSEFLVGVTSQIYVISPAAALAWSCARLTRAESLRLVSEFCGSFAVDPGSVRGFVGREPLVHIGDLTQFCSIAHRMRGASKLLGHLPFALENCASPLEAAMATLLCLPIRNGGYGLPLPTMNNAVFPKGFAERIADRSYYVGDAVWEQERVIVEYDSRMEHSSDRDVAHDNIRKLTLESQGYHVTSVTPGILFDADLFHKVALDTARRICHRLRPENFDSSWVKRRSQIRKDLLDVPLRWYRECRHLAAVTDGSFGDS